MDWGKGLLAEQCPLWHTGIPVTLSPHIFSVTRRGHQPRADGTPSPCPQPGHGSQSTRLQRFLSRRRLIRPQHWVRRASRSGRLSCDSTLMLAMNINSRKRQELTRPPADSHLTSGSVTSPECVPKRVDTGLGSLLPTATIPWLAVLVPSTATSQPGSRMAPSALSKGPAGGCLWVMHGSSEGRIWPSCSALKPSHIQTPSHQCPHIPSLGWAPPPTQHPSPTSTPGAPPAKRASPARTPAPQNPPAPRHSAPWNPPSTGKWGLRFHSDKRAP